MSINRNMPIGAAMALLKKRIADSQSALLVLEALTEQGVDSVEVNAAKPGQVERTRRRGRPRNGSLSTAQAAAIIVREAGRAMHGLDEILPALEKRGYTTPKHRASLAGALLKSGLFTRVAPGTFALKEGV